MADIKLDAENDLDVTTGDLVKLTGVPAIRQQLTIRLRFFLGEWFLDTRVGVPYYQKILVKNPNSNVIRAVFAETILETPGVLDLSDLVLDYNGTTRKLSVSFMAEVEDSDEPLDYSGEFIIGSGS